MLLIDCDEQARDALSTPLEGGGMTVLPAVNGTEGLRLFYRKRPQIVLLSMNLSDPSGWGILSRIRELSDVPVLVLGGESETERVRALRAGADDFVAEPFGHAEILARVEALTRRARATDAPELFDDGFVTIDHRRHEVEILGRRTELTPTEFRLLAAFTRHPRQALTHAQLLAMVWGDGRDNDRIVKLYVSYLRSKLRIAGVEPVETVRGIGYRYRARRLEGNPRPNVAE